MIRQLIALLLCLTTGRLVLANDLSIGLNEKQLGYYAFEKAQRNNLPPRVHSPPYRQLSVPCPGMINDKYLDNKDTLCGDLNRGFVPLNPMNVVIQNQHYPFELIKNKTLHFLARTLPYLKEDHENIPKVFKIAQSDAGFNELYSGSEASPPPATNYRAKRQVSKATITKLEKSEVHPNESAKNSQQNVSSTKKNKAVESDSAPLQQESRQKGCENDGIVCHIVQALTANPKASSDSGGLFNTIHTAYQTYQSYRTHRDSLNNFVQSLTNPIDNKSDNGNEKTGNDQYSSRPIFSQVLSAINSIGNAQTSTTASPAYSANANGNNFNNPLGALFDYFNTNSGLSSRKKPKPSEYEEYLNGLVAASSSVQPTVAKAEDQIQIAQPTPTACPSIEEYVTPVYARNYQGVWKYVVQIPHEGYFTQTLQKTNCVKNKCDYMDGQCKEASRWVSLLVAEVYYPNAKQPLSGLLPQASQLKPTVHNALNSLQHVNDLAGKLNAPHLPSSMTAAFAADQNLVNYDLFNSLLPASYNEYNHYDQTFARRASKNHQATNQAANQKAAYPASALSAAASFSVPQYQELFNRYNPEFNLNNLNTLNTQYLAGYQPNYNQQLVNTQQFAAPTKQSKTLTPAQAQMQQLVDFYQQQQYLAQLAKSSKSNANNAYSSLIDSLSSAASMSYPTVVSQSPSVGLSAGSQAINLPAQSMIGGKLPNDAKQNEIKPRSFETVNNHKILESTLLKSSYINNEDAAASNGDKLTANEQNSNQPSDLNGVNANANGVQNAAASSGGPNTEPNENGGSKESSEECDGYDTNGCYVIRVYYDWFLVNGSCKCWKTNSKTGSLETLRKILYGK